MMKSMMHGCTLRLLFVCCVVGGWMMGTEVEGNFHVGDFVQTSRRSQFHGERTTWHDLQGRHCPRYNKDSTVAIPIPKPKKYDALEEYKIQFAFDHERLLSSWLTILAKPGAPGSGFDIFHSSKLANDVLIPYVYVELWKREDELLRVKVRSHRLPEKFLQRHPDIVAEYQNRTQWPKHVLVEYRWQSVDEVDAELGLMVIIYGGTLVIFCMIMGVALTSRGKFAEFFRELATEGIQSSGTFGKEESKAE